MTMAPMEFEIVLNDEIKTGTLRAEIEKILVQKKSGEELSKGYRVKIIDEFIEMKLEHFKTYLSDFDFSNKPEYTQLNNIFQSTLKEVWG